MVMGQSLQLEMSSLLGLIKSTTTPFFPQIFDILCAFIVLELPNHLLSKGNLSSACGCVSCCVWVIWPCLDCLECLHSLGCLERSSMSELYGLQRAPRQLHHQDHQTRFLGSFPPTVPALSHPAIQTGTVYPKGIPPVRR